MSTKVLPILVSLLLIPSLAVAQSGQVTGTVTGADTEGPLPGASVLVVESDVGTATGVDGDYRIPEVEPGEKTLRFSFVGYETIERTVNVEAGGTATVNVSLSPATENVGEVVVTGVAQETPQAKLSFKVDQVSGEDLEQVSATSPMEALRGKLAGVNISQSSGEPGEGLSVQLRATNSLTGDNSPLYIVDGVILGAEQVDLGAMDIKNIEVVKGAAASSLYGSRAQNGVVNITTRRGQGNELGQTRVTVRTEVGIQSLEENLQTNQAHGFATNDQGQFVDQDGNPVNYGGKIVPDDTGPNNTTFRDNPYSELQRVSGEPYDLNNPFDQFFNPGNTYTNYVSVSQNSEQTNFRVSFEDKREQGVIQGPVSRDGYSRKNFRLNLDHRPTEDINVSASGYYSNSTSDRLGAADINPFFGLMFTNPLSDLTERDENGELVIRADPRAVEENPLYHVENAEISNDRSRFLGSLRAEYDPFSWLTLRGNLSYDRLDRTQSEFYDKGYKTVEPEDRNRGEVSEFRVTDEALNADITGSFTEDFGDLTLRSQLKYQIEEQTLNNVFLQGNDFAAVGIPNFENVRDPDSKDMSSTQEIIRSESAYGQFEADYKDRYIADFLIRRDGSSLFGPEERWQTYFRGAGAYRISEEAFWPLPEAVNEFKIRYSYGTAGARPDFNAQFETYNLNDGEFSKNTLGNPELKPELQTEQEYGVDIGLFNRVFLDVTYADTRVEDQLLQVPLPAAVGFQQQWQNAGTVESNTIEVGLDVTAIRTQNIAWELGVTFDRTRQEITSFNTNPFRTGPSDVFYYRDNEVLGSMYGNKWVTSTEQLETMGLDPSNFQENDDGYMVPVGDVSWRDGFSEDRWGTSVSTAVGQLDWGHPFKFTNEDGEQFVKIGSSIPDFNLNFNSSFQYKGFTAYFLLSYQDGGDVYNFTRQWSYRDGRNADQDESGKPQEMKKPNSYWETLYDATNINTHFLEDGTFLKVREVSVGYTFDQELLRNLIGDINPVRQLSFNITGRNLLTFTDYSGFDPEVGSGSSPNLFAVDSFQYPTFRTVTGRIEIQF